MKKLRLFVRALLNFFHLSSSIELRMTGYLVDKGWYKSYRSKQSVDKNNQPIPWLTYPFMTFIDKVAAKAGNGAVTVSISGSASKVPTGNIFKRSNNVLAGRRASDCQWKIEKALKEKKVDMSKITFTSDHSVNGPKYDGDAADQVKYETFQFVKVYIK